jgi:hypothetical protein
VCWWGSGESGDGRDWADTTCVVIELIGSRSKGIMCACEAWERRMLSD